MSLKAPFSFMIHIFVELNYLFHQKTDENIWKYFNCEKQ